LALAAHGLAAEGAGQPAARLPVRVDPARVDGAVSGGLRWLADRQIRQGGEAGSWVTGLPNYRPAVASLAGLAYLANGYLPGDESQYGKVVAQSIKYVMNTMASDGYVGQGDRSGMYIHAISTLFALSCLGMQTNEVAEPELAEWCRRSLDVIVAAQQVPRPGVAAGGWRYDPYTQESDVSVTCWQLLVLHTARQAGYEVDSTVFSLAHAYLRRAYAKVKSEAGQDKGIAEGGYLYRPGVSLDPERSATALVLFIQSLFNLTEEKKARESLAFLQRYPPTWGGPQYNGYFYFSSFYMVQGMFQIGGSEWKTFAPRLATVLLDHQTGDGSWPYPPDNADAESMSGTGPAYPVALAVLMLSIDKQYLPMYQRQRRFHETGVKTVAAAEKPVEKPSEKPNDSKEPGKDRLDVPPPTIPEPELPTQTERPEAHEVTPQPLPADTGWGDEPDEDPVIRRPGGRVF